MSYNVVVTGSDSKSKMPYFIVKFILGLHDIKTYFFSPSSWKKSKDFDGLILLGGVDIDPSFYHEKRHKSIKYTDPKRDKMEAYLLEKATTSSKPIFGICRGMQMINIFFGGNLHQHIFDLNLKYKHHKTIIPQKEIFIKKQTMLHHILKVSKTKVNVLHHQAVKTLGKDLIISAYDKNRITQAIEHKSKDILAVQWHPEYMPYSFSSKRLFKTFCDNVKQKI